MKLLTIGSVTWDRRDQSATEVLGGSVAYASLAAQALGWDAGIVTRAGADFVAEKELPGVAAFVAPAEATTRFRHEYARDGHRTLWLLASAGAIDLATVPDDWRSPSALLVAPLIDEVAPGAARGFRAGVVGAIAQGWLREADPNGRINPRRWTNAAACLEGVDILFLSQNDTPDAEKRSRELLQHVPIVALTRGARGVTLLTRNGEERFSTQPRPEVDPTGAGDVFAAAFLVSYVERHDLPEAVAFASCAASFVVQGVGAATLGDRAAVVRRMQERREYIAGADTMRLRAHEPG